MTVGIIGTNAFSLKLAQTLEQAEVKVAEVYARDFTVAQQFTDKLYDATAVSHLDFSGSYSDFFILCGTDSELFEMISEIQLPNETMLVHCSGTQALSILHPVLKRAGHENISIGVIFPLYFFLESSQVDFSEIPILIESVNEEDYRKLGNLTKKLSRNVKRVTAQQRLTYHTALTFSCGFTNHLWAITKEILESEALDFELLKPAIVQTVNRMVDASHPADLQTKLLNVNDAETINNHLNLLKDDEDLLRVYSTLIESIADWHRLV